ncbi:L-threonylcarbamoyladenylate synthase [Brevibacterium luteolum]|uniref:L-threonylcarbamoyladenylate synthase n=1 Tax=Brevibacterium luteolum TaxID=199591 RepID=UPI0021AF89D1|nr:L-threonylcarbamoyladenylate synthase [Brevibacterium luteolum]MCT1830209.1 L-threonylcarbamoyladenylate synthase [Brevibacterium luteolum]MCT1873777.1 L-threonylcarbamoyladenylate synthase [Brevibacterium luteolum]MCT1890995.1 L-threonylcarbamoyladenylate synthase [Brevibacterium luteolum]MCT1893687.1 L-threonylcarbamoyladenylate synthase [Brevibacterium luteolum]MCT1924509.1 L-threonylcarbamoyladenylate synthase [Brevibacterium luteolum]
MSRTFSIDNDEMRDLVFSECARVLESDGIIVMPTDTVYGIAADAFSATGVEKLLAAKGRGRDMPPPVLVGQREVLMALAEVPNTSVFELTKRFWPGPLTIICGAQAMLDWDLGDTHGTVAVRMPDHEAALELLRKTGPLAVSSANTHGSPAAGNAAEAEEMLGESVDIYIDGGEVPGIGASTIVDLTRTPPRILREGPISAAELREVLPDLVDIADPAAEEPETTAAGTEETTASGTEAADETTQE